jgi:thioredoxin 1
MRSILILCVLFVSVFQTSCQNPERGIHQNLSAAEFEKLMAGKPGAQLIDVRSQQEFKERHLKGATLMNINEQGFDEMLSSLDKTKPVFVYCLGGGRSATASSKMKAAGFKEIYNLKGGILEWAAAGLNIEKSEGYSGKRGLSSADLLAQLGSKPYVLVDYNAVWCGPCKRIAPVLKKFTDERKEQIMLLKVDADENPDLMIEKGIQSIPYLELYHKGKLVWKHSGIINETDLIRASGL